MKEHETENRYFLHHHHNHLPPKKHPDVPVPNDNDSMSRIDSTASIALTNRYTVAGHELAGSTSSKYHGHCEMCRHTVHGHKYYYCRNCPVVCHNNPRCLGELRRPCPAEDFHVDGWGEGHIEYSTALGSQLDLDGICLSGNLAMQNSKCFECDEVISLRGGEHNQTKARLCHYTNRFYCTNCHWNDTWCIPGSIFLLNDREEQPVCRSAFLKLSVLWDQAICRPPVDWHKENPEANDVFQLRRKFNRMKKYFSACTEAQMVKERTAIGEPPHLLGYPSSLRMKDVMDTLNGTLYPKLQQYFKKFDAHIRQCVKCANLNQKCHVCQSGTALYSYDDNVVHCIRCGRFCHRPCSHTDSKLEEVCRQCAHGNTSTHVLEVLQEEYENSTQ